MSDPHGYNGSFIDEDAYLRSLRKSLGENTISSSEENGKHMCKETDASMTDRELEALVAEKVMGLGVSRGVTVIWECGGEDDGFGLTHTAGEGRNGDVWYDPVPRYLSDPASMMEVLGKFDQWELGTRGNDEYSCGLTYTWRTSDMIESRCGLAWDKSPMRAVALAALRAKGVEV